jgi:S1-C subfamily serine protease
VLVAASLLLVAGMVWRSTSRSVTDSSGSRRPARTEAAGPVTTKNTANDPQGGTRDSARPLLTREDVVEKALSGVVTIHYETARGTVQGSGFLVSDNLIVTNKHVIDEARTAVDVELSAERSNQARATVVRCLPRADLALLELQSRTDENSALPLADLSTVRAGEDVVAVGSPKGLMGTVTRGIVSAIRTNGEVVVIQTDAAINPGNSGGPLLDMRGAVIGVNTLKYSSRDVQSIGFAVAANHVKDLLDGRESSSECSGAEAAGQQRPAEPLPSIASVTIAPNIAELRAGDTAALELRATFSDRTTGTIRPELVNWISDNPSVVTIAPSGSITAVAAGTAAIVAHVAGQAELSAELQLHVIRR